MFNYAWKHGQENWFQIVNYSYLSVPFLEFRNCVIRFYCNELKSGKLATETWKLMTPHHRRWAPSAYKLSPIIYRLQTILNIDYYFLQNKYYFSSFQQKSAKKSKGGLKMVKTTEMNLLIRLQKTLPLQTTSHRQSNLPTLTPIATKATTRPLRKSQTKKIMKPWNPK